MKQAKIKDISIQVNGVPKFSNMNREDYNSFISALEFEIRNYYKDKKKDKNLPP